MKKLNNLLFLAMLMLMSAGAWAQGAIMGTVTDNNGEALVGVSIGAAGTGKSTSSDVNGKYSLSLPNGSYQINFVYTGYVPVSRAVTISGSNMTLDITMESSDNTLEEVVISTGSRNTQRTITDSPLPIDILSNNDIRSTGQTSFDRALTYRVPSFNSVQTPVNDATSLLDPYEIRNMGPSRTLVLINGKRKNTSSLVYIQTSPGRGEGGADLSAIPTDAIKRVEILRDGASAQYGSDAIAGVMNVILKDRYEYGSVTLNTGITGKGDGEMIGLSINNGANFGEKGYVNYTAALSYQALANRPGDVDADGEAGDFGADLDDVRNFLSRYPDAGNVNGDPEKASGRFLINAGIPVGENAEIYGNAAYVYKKVNSFANYRTPYWRGPEDNPYAVLAAAQGKSYDGYLPTFEGDLTDYNATVGLRGEKNGWNSDLSYTTGYNQQLYTVNNTRNRTLGLNSPLAFKPGGYAFQHNVMNIDISKMLVDNLNFSMGAEFRQETYEIIQGDTASYVGTGADSFPGTRSNNASKNSRNNIGGYVGLGFDITKDFLIDATVRTERYSDFGNTFVYKLSSRYKLMDDKLTLRASYSTGFRAPQLHQIYLQISQQSFVPGQGIQNKGIFNNASPQAKLLGIEKLRPEESTNFTAGVGLKPNSNLNITLDYYNIAVDDRIILGSEITGTGDPTNALDQVLNANGIVAASFFTNGINTRTSGIDMVLSYRNVQAGSGKLGFNLAANYVLYNKLDSASTVSEYEEADGKQSNYLNYTSVANGSVNNPALIENAGKSLFDPTQEALLLTSRPQFKAILGIDYAVGKFNFALNNTLFGSTTFRQAGLNQNLKTVFKPAVVTDLAFNYQISKTLSLGINANNLLNVLPKWELKARNSVGEAILADPAQVKTQSNLITFNQRYAILTYDGSQFGQLGTTLAANLTVRF
ncbi:MAG TPA: ferric enterobactin receptor [Saprospirales bacterium]|nr:ferric enterobactin receptor [Saprospirales bacterium]